MYYGRIRVILCLSKIFLYLNINETYVSVTLRSVKVKKKTDLKGILVEYTKN